jgi:adenylate kinase family enzyme
MSCSSCQSSFIETFYQDSGPAGCIWDATGNYFCGVPQEQRVEHFYVSDDVLLNAISKAFTKDNESNLKLWKSNNKHAQVEVLQKVYKHYNKVTDDLTDFSKWNKFKPPSGSLLRRAFEDLEDYAKLRKIVDDQSDKIKEMTDSIEELESTLAGANRIFDQSKANLDKQYPKGSENFYQQTYTSWQ